MRLYFAYGSNMDRAGMRHRCPGARPAGTGVLHGWRLLVMSGGYVSIARRTQARVHGVLWRLTPCDLMALDLYEAVASGLYRRRVLPVFSGGKRIAALVYVGRSLVPGRAQPGHLPLVIAAAQSWRLPPRYIGELQQLAQQR